MSRKGREDEEGEKAGEQRGLRTGEVLEVDLLVKESGAGLLQTLLGTKVGTEPGGQQMPSAQAQFRGLPPGPHPEENSLPSQA